MQAYCNEYYLGWMIGYKQGTKYKLSMKKQQLMTKEWE